MSKSVVGHLMSGARDHATIYGIQSDILKPVTGPIAEMTMITNALTTVEATPSVMHQTKSLTVHALTPTHCSAMNVTC